MIIILNNTFTGHWKVNVVDFGFVRTEEESGFFGERNDLPDII